MKLNYKLLFSLWLVLFFQISFSQEAESEYFKNKNSFLLNFGYTHVPGGSDLESESQDGFFVPTIGFDYGREVGERWELLLMLDLELGKYLIRSRELNRENAFMVLGGTSYKVLESIYVIGGFGVEFEKNENLFVTRLGGEYIYELQGPWGLMAGAYWDYKQEYSTYSLVVGAGYRF